MCLAESMTAVPDEGVVVATYEMMRSSDDGCLYPRKIYITKNW